MPDHLLIFRLIQLLSAVPSQSLDALSQQLCLSKSELQTLLQNLIELGCQSLILNNEQVTLLQSIELLDQQQMIKTLERVRTDVNPLLSVHLSVSSTNEVLRSVDFNESMPYICLAEHQSNGKGRRGNRWESPFARNIYLSLGYRCQISVDKLGLISLLTGASLAKTLTDLGLSDIWVKWPNDIYHNEKKLAGILIDVKSLSSSYADLIMGIGLNYSMVQNREINQPWTSLCQISNDIPGRTDVVTTLLTNLFNDLKRFEEQGFSFLASSWKQYDYLLGKPVTISGNEYDTGVANGINTMGELILITDSGIKTVRSGEVSVRLS